MEQSTLSFKHQYSGFVPILLFFFISHQIDYLGCLSKNCFIVFYISESEI